jgi:hypothetical protein
MRSGGVEIRPIYLKGALIWEAHSSTTLNEVIELTTLPRLELVSILS